MEYYENQFSTDLLRYCQGRSDIFLTGVFELENSRNIRFGVSDWEPAKQHDFLFCLYFTVLTDMVLHSHFPKQHIEFDQLAMYPKLFGIGVRQRLLPRHVLSDIRFKRNDATAVEQLWRSYCDYFIRDWQKSLPGICGVDGPAFLRALLTDPDFSRSARERELRFAEREDGGRSCLEGEGNCMNPSGYFESVLLGLIGKEVRRLEKIGSADNRL